MFSLIYGHLDRFAIHHNGNMLGNHSTLAAEVTSKVLVLDLFTKWVGLPCPVA